MADHEHRNCLNHLFRLSAEAHALDHTRVAAEVDRMLACNGRRACTAYLTCSWLASDLATSLAQRYR